MKIIPVGAKTRPDTSDNDARALAQAHRLARSWPWTEIPPRYRRHGPIPQAIADKIAPALNLAHQRLPVLLLTGQVGAGKTSTACRIAAWIASAYGWYGPEAIRYQLGLKMGWLDPETADELGKSQLVILDDFGGALTQAAMTKTLEVLETRIGWDRRTIITSTLTVDQIAAVEAEKCGREIGVASRITGGVVLDLGDIDRRAVQDVLAMPQMPKMPRVEPPAEPEEPVDIDGLF